MTKRNRLLIILTFVLALAIVGLYLRQKQGTPLTYLNQKSGTNPKTKPGSTEPTIDGRRVINLPVGKEKEALASLKLTNKVTDTWQESVEASLKRQGGAALKKILIEKVESLIWTQPGFALNVESVRITLVDNKGQRTLFRALVDSQSGKILQTWDRPVIDSFNPREKKGIKIDPSYFNN